MSKNATGVLIAAPAQGADGQRLSQRLRVYRTVLEAIRARALAPGARLPSARLLAAEWRMARSAVDEAFEQLQIEGLIERRVGDGTYVREQALPPPPAAGPPVLRPPSAQALAVMQRFAVYMGQPRNVELPLKVLAPEPLFPRTPMTAEFPLDIWRRLVTRAHGEEYRHLLTYGPAAGLPQTREAIARHLALTRGMRVQPGQVIVLNSPMQALELVVRVLLEPGDSVWVEDPGHASLGPLLRAMHCHVVGVPFDGQGLDVAAGRARAARAAAVYLHPLAQFPLGVATSTARRVELLQWADECGAWVIEGNMNDELAHSAEAPLAFQQIDRADRVLTMGTFEGILYPALRLAYLVVPQRLVDVFVAVRGLLGDHSSTAMQLALTWFIDEGHMSQHLRRLRRLGAERRAALEAAAAAHLPPWARLGPTVAATHACVHLPPEVPDRPIVQRLRQRDVLSFALSSVAIDSQAWNGLVLGCSAFEPAQIAAAMATIGEVLREPVPTAPQPRESPGAPPAVAPRRRR